MGSKLVLGVTCTMTKEQLAFSFLNIEYGIIILFSIHFNRVAPLHHGLYISIYLLFDWIENFIFHITIKRVVAFFP